MQCVATNLRANSSFMSRFVRFCSSFRAFSPSTKLHKSFKSESSKTTTKRAQSNIAFTCHEIKCLASVYSRLKDFLLTFKNTKQVDRRRKKPCSHPGTLCSTLCSTMCSTFCRGNSQFSRGLFSNVTRQHTFHHRTHKNVTCYNGAGTHLITNSCYNDFRAKGTSIKCALRNEGRESAPNCNVWHILCAFHKKVIKIFRDQRSRAQKRRV